MSDEAKQAYDGEQEDDPRMEATGNTKPAESDEAVANDEGEVADAPEGAKKEEYPGPMTDADEGEEKEK